MSHGITATDKITYYGEVPWHGIGEAQSAPMLAVELQRISADYTVKQVPVFAQVNGHSDIVSTHWAQVRSDTLEVLWVVGQGHINHQPNEIAELCDFLTKGERVWTVSGTLDGSRKLFFVADMGESKVSGDPSPMKRYLTVATSFDGSMATEVYTSHIRTVCNNTLQMSRQSARDTIKIKHTKNSTERLEIAKQLMVEATNYWESFEILANKMAETHVSDEMINDFIEHVLPAPKVKRTKTVNVNHVNTKTADNTDILAEVLAATKTMRVPDEYLPARTQNARTRLFEIMGLGLGLEEIKGTAWGVYNAYAEFIDHDTSYRETEQNSRENNRAESILMGQAKSKKEKALDYILETVGISATCA